jgi:ABC-2 type transport system ATP-binding protein
MENQAIVVKNLSKIYPGNVQAVNDVSFSVKQGEFFGFLGPNGAGKTTTMKILSTLLNPTSGEALINNYTLGKQNDDIRCSIGFAMQGITLDLTASALENLYLIGALYEMSKKEIEVRIKELLKLLELEKVAKSWVKNYSGGMKKRLDLAVALIHKPELIFLDEPTEGLDPVGRRKVWDYLKKLNKEGITVFLTTHYMQEAEYLCDRLAIIDKGKIVVLGSPEELKNKVNGTLDDVFINYTGHDINDEDLNTKAPDPYISVQ